MKYVSTILGLLLSFSLFADWGDEIMSLDAVKHWRMDDRVVHVRGRIVETYGFDGFRIADDTGEIRVHFTNHELRDFHFKTGMRVEVKGLIVHEDHHHHEWRDHHWDLEASSVRLHDGIVIGRL